MRKLIRPIDYRNCNINLISSILDYYGAIHQYPTLKIVDEHLNRKYNNIVFIVLDGLGNKILQKHSEFGILNESKVAVIDSVYPPTTVAAINSFESGLAPIEHGWLGWSLYFKEIDVTMDVFPEKNTITGEIVDLSQNNPKELLSYKTIFTKIKEGTFDEVERYRVYPSYIKSNVVDYNYVGVESISEFFDKISDIVNSNKKEKFIYAYWPDPDYEIHSHGVDSPIITSTIEKIEEELEKCVDDCEDTIFIITADHGLIDNKTIFELNDYPDILDCLSQRPDIESRTFNFRIKKGKEKEFVTLFNKYFDKYYHLYSKEEVLKSKIFGDFDKHPKVDDFLGDYIAIAYSDGTIFKNDKNDHKYMAASHAGITSDEIKVPLIIIEKPLPEY